MSPNGAANNATGTVEDNDRSDAAADSPDDFFVPNFCDARMVLGVVLISELIALTFALVRPAPAGFLTELARFSVLMQWLGLTSAGLLCLARGPLRGLSTAPAAAAVMTLVAVNILVLSIAIAVGGRWLAAGGALGLFPTELWPFALRNLAIGAIVTGLLLRYFFVTHQWRRHVRAEARSRIDALQARIRPHFLFNSMNTIASLTRSEPARAEEAVEDLADLFRASLSEADRLLSLKEELELTRIYQRIESLRLGERLRVEWQIADLPMRAKLPGLTLQPLLENAIYHGIEPLDQGGLVTIRGWRDDQTIRISVTNPTPRAIEAGPGTAEHGHRGHQIAVANIRERLRLAFAGRATLAGHGTVDIDESGDRYCVTVSFPIVE